MTEVQPVTQVQHSFQAFFWKHMDMIYTAWDNGQHNIALQRALRLIDFLPNELYEKLKEQQTEALKELEAAYRATASTFHATQLAKTHSANTVASRYLRQIVRNIINVTDQRGYLEQKPMRPRFQTKKKLKV